MSNLIRLIMRWMVGGVPVVAVIAGMSVGGMVPPQGNALRALGLYLGSTTLAVLTSLGIGFAFFGTWTLFKRRSGIKKVFRRNILKWRRRDWEFASSGSPGACFIASYSISFRDTEPFMASLAAVLGLTLFIFTKWRNLENWERALAITSTICVVGATVLNGETVQQQSMLGWGKLITTMVLAIGVSWQFQTLAKIISIPTVTIRAAAAISTASGFLTALVLHGIFVLVGWSPLLPVNPWPTATHQLWMYTCGIAGIWIIPVGTFASKQLGKIYPVVMVSGNLLCGLAIGWITNVAVASKIALQIASAALAIAGVALNVNARVRQGFNKIFGVEHHPVG